MNRNYKRYNFKLIYNRLLNRVIIVLSILVIVLIIKVINSSVSKRIIQIIENNIYYQFTWTRDGKKIGEYMKNTLGNTIESIEIFNMDGNE